MANRRFSWSKFLIIEITAYYDEFLRYFKMAEKQQELCNVSKTAPYGMTRHEDSGVQDSLMEHVHLYDVVERKYAGFSQIVNDAFYGWGPEHPYWQQMIAGKANQIREETAKNWDGKQKVFSLPEWLYVFLFHRITGSGINYSQKPSGYYNTLLLHLHQADTIEGMVGLMKNYPAPFYTSVGYQFPAFPKPPVGYKRGGDFYLAEYAPRLVREMAEWLEKTYEAKDFRSMGDWLFDWNAKNGLRAYRFQYAAFLADIADWFPQYVNKESMFYYGSNAVECISYLAKPINKMKQDVFLDAVMEQIYEDTGSIPYNAEDVCCDFIRWVENYVRPGSHYDHLDFDKVWSSCKIMDHPFGRQKAMLDLGLVKTFNGMTSHPSDDFILQQSGIVVETYKKQVHAYYSTH